MWGCMTYEEDTGLYTKGNGRPDKIKDKINDKPDILLH